MFSVLRCARKQEKNKTHIGVIFQNYEKLDRASRKFIEYIVERACIEGNKYNRGQD